jgi:hypothetical protein
VCFAFMVTNSQVEEEGDEWLTGRLYDGIY